jgi:hypothetical protein
VCLSNIADATCASKPVINYTINLHEKAVYFRSTAAGDLSKKDHKTSGNKMATAQREFAYLDVPEDLRVQIAKDVFARERELEKRR